MRTDSLLAFGMPAAILTSTILLVVSVILAVVVIKLSTKKNTMENAQPEV
jgi:hypothetical protein